jgi:hypothetical protein
MAINKKGIVMTLVGGVIAALGISALAKKDKAAEVECEEFNDDENRDENGYLVEEDESEA